MPPGASGRMKRRTASGSSAASSTVSASSASAPTGVLSSWLVLATKSRRTSSTRLLSVWSSASSSTRPPSPTAAPSGATRTAKLVVRPLKLLVDTSISPSRISPFLRTWRTSASSSPTIRSSPLTSPNARAAELVSSTRSSLSRTTGSRGENGENGCNASRQPGRLGAHAGTGVRPGRRLHLHAAAAPVARRRTISPQGIAHRRAVTMTPARAPAFTPTLTLRWYAEGTAWRIGPGPRHAVIRKTFILRTTAVHISSLRRSPQSGPRIRGSR